MLARTTACQGMVWHLHAARGTSATGSASAAAAGLNEHPFQGNHLKTPPWIHRQPL